MPELVTHRVFDHHRRTPSSQDCLLILGLDLELQRPMETLSPSDASFAEDQLKTWLYGIALNRIPSVILPIEFGWIEHQTRFGQDEEESEDEHQASPRKKKKGSGPNNCMSCEGNINPSWRLPTGKEYGQVFKGDALRGWPLADQRTSRKETKCLPQIPIDRNLQAAMRLLPRLPLRT
jgi:hypothetical protein